MTGYILRRLAQAVPLALIVVTLVFGLLHLIPGDPAEIMLGESASPADVEALRQRLGLDLPLPQQYFRFLGGLARGDLGVSLHFERPVSELLLERFPATLVLTFAAMAVALLIALPLGVAAARFRNGWIDHGSRLFALLGVSIPNFWLGPMLIWLFAVYWNLLPVSGREGRGAWILPAVTLGTALAGFLARMIRASLVEEMGRPYLTTARAKGLGATVALWRHGIKNALIPVVTVVGLQLGALLTGSIITETIFAWPGIGRLLIQSIRWRDYPLVQGGVLLIALVYILVNLFADLLYAALDPRVREV